ncbi:MAG: 4-alpha-glucanotransferase [Polyangiaceae bacterium]|nr:4-alpha-glucanotransferase [Polyangiaceae bacterium]
MDPVRNTLRVLYLLARQYGVQTSYVDMAKQRREASPESLLAVLRTLGVDVTRMSDVPRALRETRHARAQRVLEPVCVAWGTSPAAVPLRLPNQASAGHLRCKWILEDGTPRRIDSRLQDLPTAPGKGSPRRAGRNDARRRIVRYVAVPRGLPTGYHRLVVECGGDRFESLVFSAPEACFQGPVRKRTWGVFAPLYALHSDTGLGAGNFADLAKLVSMVSEHGGGFVGTLPLLPAFLSKPCEPSPYSPLSRLFWNEFYLDLEQIPELDSCAAARRLMASSAWRQQRDRLRRAPLVDYVAQMALQRAVLEVLSKSFFTKASSRRDAFQRFCRPHPELETYARFRAVHERRGQPWTRWPARMRDGELRDGDSPVGLRRYHLYVQWLAQQQMTRLSEHARTSGVDLYLDMPLGTHRDGYDTWRHPQLFALDASGGAPPDPVFTRGQDWGFAPIHPQRSREQGHAYIRSYLRRHLEHARMLRFDHVMGLHRLYWVPRGLPASEGAYVTYPAEEFYAMLSIESHRHHAAIIGENLGTVPAEVNRSLRRHGVSGMFVVQYEARPAPSSALRRVERHEIARLSTHDMPPFAAFWAGLDIEDRRALGLIKPQNLARERRLRERVRTALHRLLRQRRLLGRNETGTAAVCRGVTEYLGASPARWLLVNLEDLWQETASQNTPGTSTERVNWRRKLRFSLEAIERDGRLLEAVRSLSARRRF